jgi:hypothetical protein
MGALGMVLPRIAPTAAGILRRTARVDLEVTTGVRVEGSTEAGVVEGSTGVEVVVRTVEADTARQN